MHAFSLMFLLRALCCHQNSYRTLHDNLNQTTKSGALFPFSFVSLRINNCISLAIFMVFSPSKIKKHTEPFDLKINMKLIVCEISYWYQLL